ncbi:cytochrome P450 [Nonomuraea sp. NPDC046802]|uniref:cytochrome P450 n=1 Tax=Nonomuraea sp. NPDC046802 TaxID=3154919 RepID=UPI0033C923CD
MARPLPMVRTRPLDPPAELGRLRAEHPISRLAYPDGHVGWLVTGHAAARAILAHPDFSARAELQRRPVGYGSQEPAGPGIFINLDAPEHTRYRRLITGQFTVRRMRELEPRIEEITAGRLDAMERLGPPLDLVESFALPIPSLVICELLGVPYADRERFQQDTAVIASLDATAEQARAATADIAGYLRELVLRKRADPAGDLISDLARGGELNDEELTGLAVMLLIAGHETTASMLSLSTLALLSDPSQPVRLRADPSLMAGAVEELLRYLSIIHLGPTRTAVQDIELYGVRIAAGETVTISLPAANRDPDRFPDPDELLLTRPTGGHVAFGHGIHQCIGQQLARVELRVGLNALLRRFPELRLAVAQEDIGFRTDAITYGVRSLPVTWTPHVHLGEAV